ncbi:MAG: hypothetical protein WCH32_11010 [Pseudomonadota bacterium]
MRRFSACSILLLATTAACSSPPPPAEKPAPTVFDELVSKEKTLPAAVEKAQREHMDALHEQEAAADGQSAGAAPR